MEQSLGKVYQGVIGLIFREIKGIVRDIKQIGVFMVP